jgi:hypothetical protein
MSGRPTSGARFELVREDAGGADAGSGRIRYRGFVRLPAADLPIEADVELSGGGVVARIDRSGAGAADIGELERIASALVRSVTKSAAMGGRPFPRKIVRWRG